MKPQAAAKGRYDVYFKIKDYHAQERPREKLLQQGGRALTQAELLGILIGSGVPNMNSVDLARKILAHHDYNLHFLARQSVEALQQFRGIGKAKAALIVSALELGRRLQEAVQARNPKVESAETVYELMKSKLSGRVSEEFWVLLVSQSHYVIKVVPISIGGLTKTVVDARLILKEALLLNAPKVVLVHNHPGGSVEPSAADIQLTQRVVQAGETVNVQVMDHIIFAEGGFFSFAAAGLMK